MEQCPAEITSHSATQEISSFYCFITTLTTFPSAVQISPAWVTIVHIVKETTHPTGCTSFRSDITTNALDFIVFLGSDL